MTTVLLPPGTAPSRNKARQVTSALPADLRGAVVTVDCGSLGAATPSFVDELVVALLGERQADLLILDKASTDVADFARDAAQQLGVLDRLKV